MKPSIPKGTRDFLPAQVYRREYIFGTVRRAFQLYGYQPIETPAMENLATLTGKYGEEGDKLLFKVLNNGDYLAKADQKALDERDSNGLVASISKRGLRYDLTVPFARYVVMHQNDLSFPFKRYAIQPVWRADRPQKGRYQEFYQCDADVVGSPSLVYEAELVRLFDVVFNELGLKVVIRLNNRKILAALAEVAGHSDKMMDITIAIDKLDKIGIEGVRRELDKRDIPAAAQDIIEKFLAVDSLDEFEPLVADSEIGREGLAELREVFDFIEAMSVTNRVTFDVKLARGLNYYTGAIFEVEVDLDAHPGVKMGSIASGGRYADLTGIFGMKDMPGVGISFGAERIYDVLEELELFPDSNPAQLTALIVCLDDETMATGFKLVNQLREAGINSDLYPTAAKLNKMLKYANQRDVPHVIIIGSEEAKSGVYSVKNMRAGEQVKLDLAGLISQLQS
ncbi:histidine--tRNA ligase [Lewinellaceae bacterium SD302]|nr:histidine--tRNA ligase [Lewinellaceae bacterium SD302]